MKAIRRSLCIGMFAFSAFYIAWPYLTLWRLDGAIRQGDATTLHELVNWYRVREGIKEDLCDLPPESAEASTRLPGFGESFIRGVMANAVDRRVTPEGLVAAVRQHPTGSAPRGAGMTITWAFFDSLAGFVVSLTAPGQTEAVTIRLELRDASWRVTRVWLPDALLRQTNLRT